MRTVDGVIARICLGLLFGVLAAIGLFNLYALASAFENTELLSSSLGRADQYRQLAYAADEEYVALLMDHARLPGAAERFHRGNALFAIAVHDMWQEHFMDDAIRLHDIETRHATVVVAGDVTINLRARGAVAAADRYEATAVTPAATSLRDILDELARISYKESKDKQRRAGATSIRVQEGSGLMTLFGIMLMGALAFMLIEYVRRLTEARQAALAASASKGQFLAKMSHEIRTPLHGIISTTQLLLTSALGPRQRRLATIIGRSGRTLLEIIDEILDLSKLEAGKLKLEAIDFNLCDVIEEVIDTFAEQAAKKGLTLRAKITQTPQACVIGDPVRVRQIVSNLVSNAVKFTERGDVSVELRFPHDDGAHVVSEIVVRDTGIGIADAFKDRLFESFSQADDATTRRFGGTGLGLAIVKQIVDLLGGEIHAESTLGKGTVFSLFVPFDKGDPCGAASCQPPQQLNGLRCLVVEGDVWSRESLREQLERWHAHCSVASSGEEALAILHSDDTFSAAFVASSLSDMTALELIERVRSAEVATATSFAVMGSLREHRDDDAIARLRIDDWLYAPIRSSDVYNVLVRMIETPVAVHEAAPEPASAPASETPPPAAHQSARILLAEDNLVNQEVMYETAAYLGYRITVVANGAEAVEAVRNGEFDLVLMDCHMPVLDGYAATAAIRDLERANPARRRTPIVALSANAMDDDKRRCLEAGMDDHLAKPFALQDLRATIEQWAGAPPPVPEEREPAIDPRALERIAALRRPGRPDPVARIVASFLNDMPVQLDALSEAINEGAFGALRDGAHSLKSSSANVGATKLAALFRELERQGTERDGVAAPATLRAIHAEYAIVTEQLTTYLAPGEPGAV